MANPYFNNFNCQQEQDLHENLVIEAIEIYGFPTNYIPRNTGDIDPLWLEDTTSDFSSNEVVDMYFETFESYEGEGDFMSKFGIQIDDQLKLRVAKKTFDEGIGLSASLARPREGDLIFVSMTNSVFEITFVEHENPFYQFGKLNSYVLTLEKYKYSHETFNTGIPLLDNFVATIDELSEDPQADNSFFETEGDSFIDFSERDPFSEGPDF